MITLMLSRTEIQMLINAVEILRPDDPEAQELCDQLYCRLVSMADSMENSAGIDREPETHSDKG